MISIRDRVEPTMEKSPNSEQTTQGMRVEAAAQFVPSESAPGMRRYLYNYRIRFVNEGTENAQLLSRHWIILDAENNREEVIGEGVVGKYPDLAPGETFEYTSYCPLRTEWGTMEGSYTFQRKDGSTFDAEIGRFFLFPSVDNMLVAK